MGKKIPIGGRISNGLAKDALWYLSPKELDSILYPSKLKILPQMIFQFTHTVKMMRICKESYSTLYHYYQEKALEEFVMSKSLPLRPGLEQWVISFSLNMIVCLIYVFYLWGAIFFGTVRRTRCALVKESNLFKLKYFY